jgi:outer membrane beta-barrel protein/carboxypeptidase-like protein
MPKQLFLFVLTLFSSLAFSQNSFTIKGKIIEENSKLPMESVTVYLSMTKDSSLVDYTITDKNGNFSLPVKKIAQPVSLKISMVGFEDHKTNLNELLGAKDFGVISLKEQSKMLGDLVIKAEAPPVRIKKDTLEFNAASFKVRPDSNVQTLLKQLPGVEIDNEGKITVNGKEVNQILVNGKPFFDKDGKVALQNLPSDIINKVQITDTKTKKEELTKQAASSNNASINLTIDEEKNKGLFGKFMAGYGTDERYESSALINYFKNKRKINVLASSNNINSLGFSMDEVFDNMGGGRNITYMDSGTGSFGMGNMRFGANGSGITQSDMVGINYTDEWFKGFESTGSYFFSDQHTKNNNRSRQISFLPTGDFTTESQSTTKSDGFGNNVNFEMEYKIDSTTTLVVSPKFSKTNAKNKETSVQNSRDENDDLLNESASETFTESDVDNFKNSIYFNKALNKKGKYLSFSFENENSKNESFNSNKSSTIFYQGTDPDDLRDQIRKTRNIKDYYTAELSFSQPIKDSLIVKMGLEYDFKKSLENKKAFDFDATTQGYTNQNDFLTNYISSETKTITPTVGVNIETKSVSLDVTAGSMIAQFDNHSLYLDNVTDLKKNYLLPSFRTFLNYKMSKSKSIWANYNYQINFPTAFQVLPVEDLANPLSTFIGNPDLGLNKNHYLYVSFRDYDYVKKSGYSFYVGGNYYDNQIVSSTVFDENRKRTTTYRDVSNTYYTWSGINWNKTIKKETHTYKFTAGGGVNFSMNKGFSNDVMYDAFGVRYRARAGFTYEYGELLTVNPTYSYTFNETKYTNYSIGKASNYQHLFNIQTTSYWPKNWVFGNDFGYTYNSNIADGFKKDFFLWNSSLAYNFYDKKFTAKVKVYDLLNQNQSAMRTISATTIRDEENTVLKRYLMFSLTYKIEKFGGKEKKSNSRFMMH